MKIIFRNFIKLLSSGAFITEESVEIMSEFKWKRLLQIAEASDVKDIISSGIAITHKHNNTIIPYNIIEESGKNIIHPKETSRQKEESNKFTQLPVKKFSNFYLNRKLNKIIYNEIHSIDTSVDTLTFINKLIDNVNILISTGINPKELVNLGLYLRTNGNTIDFLKIERWLKQLKMRRISDLIGSLLIVLLNLEKQEIPFLKDTDKNSERYILSYLNDILDYTENLHKSEKQTSHTTSGTTYPTKKTTYRYFKYFPLEIISSFISHIIKSISNIEE